MGATRELDPPQTCMKPTFFAFPTPTTTVGRGGRGGPVPLGASRPPLPSTQNHNPPAAKTSGLDREHWFCRSRMAVRWARASAPAPNPTGKPGHVPGGHLQSGATMHGPAPTTLPWRRWRAGNLGTPAARVCGCTGRARAARQPRQIRGICRPPDAARMRRYGPPYGQGKPPSSDSPRLKTPGVGGPQRAGPGAPGGVAPPAPPGVLLCMRIAIRRRA